MDKSPNTARYFPVRDTLGQSILWIASIAAIYFVASRFSLFMVFKPEGIAAVWPPAGIFLSALLLTRRALRPFLVAILFIADVPAEMLAGSSTLVSLLYAGVLSCEAVLGCWLLERALDEPITFEKTKHVLCFLVLPVIGATAMTSLLAAATSAILIGAPFWISYRSWWSSDAIGNLLITPFLLSWASLAHAKKFTLKPGRIVEGTAMWIAMLLLGYFARGVFPEQHDLSLLFGYMSFPFLIWAALRYGVRSVTSAIILIATLAIQFALFHDATKTVPDESRLKLVIVVQLCLGVVAVSSLCLAAVMTERKRSEELLLESSRFNEQVISGAREGIIVCDLNSRFQVWNPYMEQLSGMSAGEVLGKHFQELFPFLLEAGVVCAVEKALRGEIPPPLDFSYNFLPAGKTAWASTTIAPLRNMKGEIVGIIATVRDITEHIQILQSLRESEERLVRAQEVAHAGNWELDLAANTMWGSAEAFRIYGLERTSPYLPLDQVQRIIVAEDRTRMDGALHALLQARAPYDEEFRILRANDGAPRVIHTVASLVCDTDGTPFKAAGVIQDITERKRAEEQTKDALNYLRTMMERSPFGIVAVKARGDVVAANEAVARMVGGTVEQLLKQNVLQLEAWKKYGLRLAAEEALAKNEERQLETYYISTFGKALWLSIRFVPFEHGGEPHLLAMLEDTTERNRAEEELRNSEKRYRLLVECSPTGILIHSEGKVVYANPAFTRLVGAASPEELNGRDVMDFVHPDFRAVVLERTRSVQASARTAPLLEEKFLRVDGSPVDVEVIGVPFVYKNKPAVQVIVNDITERKRTEATLRENEARYRLLFENNPQPMWVYDLETLAFVTVNEAAIRHYGYSREEFLAMTIKDIRPAEDIPALLADVANLPQGPRQAHLWRHQKKDGTIIVVEIRSHSIPFADRPARLVLATDITERQRAEEALKESEEKFRGLYLQSPIGVEVYDAEGRLVDANPACLEIFGVSDLQHVKGFNLFDDPNIPASAKEELRRDQVVRYEAAFDFEKVKRKSLYPTSRSGLAYLSVVAVGLMTEGQIRGYLIQMQDITGRRQTELALRERNRFVDAVLENSPIGFAVNTIHDGKSVFGSSKFYDIYGIPRGKTISVDEFFETVYRDPDFRAQIRQRITTDIASGDPSRMRWENIPITTSAGEHKVVSASNIPLFDQDLMVSTVQDVTKRFRAEEEIRRLNEELEQRVAERTAQLEAANKELEAFSYSVSHDLRAPLRAIDGYTRMLVEDYEKFLDADGQRICGVVCDETRKMGQLIDDLLAFSRLGRLQMQASPIDMGGLAHSVFRELTSPLERKRISFQVESLPQAWVDPHLIHQVWTNLLSNALKFSSLREHASIKVHGRAEGSENIYSVTDNGAGFDMEYAPKLFGVFQRLHGEREFKGTGVGLAIVQRIIRRHGGRVWAEGQVNQGATFYFALPRKGNES